MVRASQAQLDMFRQNQRGDAAKKTAAPRPKRQKQLLPENQVRDAVIKMLESHGWQCDRVLAGTFKTLDGKRFVVGAKTGRPDYICTRGPVYFWLEFKSTLGKLRPLQDIFFEQARRDGRPCQLASDYDRF